MSIFDEPGDQGQPQEAQQQEEAQQEEQPQQQEEVGKDSMVPLSALNESRARQRQIESELNELKGRYQQFETLKSELDEYRSSQQKGQAENEFNSDPLGVMKRELDSLKNMLESGQSKNQETQEQAQRQQQVFMQIANQVQEFKKSVPDYDKALEFVVDARRKELEVLGLPESDIQQVLAQHQQEIAETAVKTGQNAGELVYNLAKVRGYQAKQVADKIDAVAKGQAASSSLSNTSGSDNDLSLTNVASMSDDEFDKLWSEMERQERTAAH